MKVSNIDAITRLLSLGADVALKNRDGQDASAVAAHEGAARAEVLSWHRDRNLALHDGVKQLLGERAVEVNKASMVGAR